MVPPVTPLVGVWIEIFNKTQKKWTAYVTPLVGVWIEMVSGLSSTLYSSSLPLWECGLKSKKQPQHTLTCCHSPCGSVD